MRLTWVAYGTIGLKEGAMYSNFASSRYRVILPMLALSRRGHEITIAQISDGSALADVMPQIDGDLVVFSKLISPDRNAFHAASLLRQAVIDRLQAESRKVVADINDDHFDDDFYGPSFRDVVQRADAVVVSTPEMQRVVARHTSRATFVVSDPYEGPHGAPTFLPPHRGRRSPAQWLKRPEPLRIVWFGHHSNWSSMEALLPELARSRVVPLELEIITTPGSGIEDFCARFNAQNKRACALRFTPWSREATWAGLNRAAIVLLPSRADDPTNAVKSPNRLVEALRAGRYVVGTALPSYQAFAAYADLGDDLVQRLEAALAHGAPIRDRISAGQTYIQSEYSPEAIGAKWENVLQQIAR